MKTEINLGFSTVSTQSGTETGFFVDSQTRNVYSGIVASPVNLLLTDVQPVASTKEPGEHRSND